MQVGARELRTRTAEILRAVEDGEEVIITYRGRPVAEITRLSNTLSRKGRGDDSEFFGMWKDRKDMEDPERWVRELREERSRRLYSTRTS